MIVIGKTKRKEVRFSDEEWERVLKLSAEAQKTTMAYIRDKAVSGKALIDADDTGVIINGGKAPVGPSHRRRALSKRMNDVAHTVNTEKCVCRNNVDEAERIIAEFEEMLGDMKTINFREMDI